MAAEKKPIPIHPLAGVTNKPLKGELQVSVHEVRQKILTCQHLSLGPLLSRVQEGPHLLSDVGASEGLIQGGAWRRTDPRLLPERTRSGHLPGHQP